MIQKLEDGRYKLDFYPAGRNGRRVMSRLTIIAGRLLVYVWLPVLVGVKLTP